MRSHPFDPLAIFKNSGKLSASNLFRFGLEFIISLVTARILGPENVGILALVGVWSFYARLVRPGLLSAAGRDMPHLLGAGEKAEARRIQNIAITGEMLFSLLPCALLVIAGFFYSSSVIRTGMWLTALAFEITAFQAIFMSLLFVHQQFSLITRLNFILSTLSPIGILLTINWLGIYSPLLMPALAGSVGVLVILRHRRIIDYRPAWDWDTAQTMVKAGLPLSILTVVSWAYFMSDRPAILAAGLSLTMVGYYAFASNIIRGVSQIFWDFTGVLQPILWQEIGRRGSVGNVTVDLIQVWVPYTALTCLAATIGHALFGAVVAWAAPQFAPSVPVFEILVFILVFYNATQLPNLVLCSKAVNRQNFNLFLWSLGLVLNLSTLYLLALAGYSLTVIAAASMGIDLILVIVGYASIQRYLFDSWQSALVFYRWMSGIVLVPVILYFLFQGGPFAYIPGGDVAAPLMLRAFVGLLVWGGVVLMLLRWWQWRAPDVAASAAT